ncbi:unnamed protein product [Orchesella dallaii]|uniref:Ionotropic glutamate receptor C-terminal domain-containing protein n=1 Tax=Orchesella dallaii TaxID=48710 RepID=A0ABP1S7D6_9HEXA
MSSVGTTESPQNQHSYIVPLLENISALQEKCQLVLYCEENFDSTPWLIDFLLSYRNMELKPNLGSYVFKKNPINSPRFQPAVRPIQCTLCIIQMASLDTDIASHSLWKLVRKDSDYFVYFIQSVPVGKYILKSEEIGENLNFKTVILLKNTSGEILSVNEIGHLTEYSLGENPNSGKMFLDSPPNFGGITFKISVPYYPSIFQWDQDSKGKFKISQGKYATWLKILESKFNFTSEYFTSSDKGSSATQNGSQWKGAVGDVLNGDAHMALDIAHTFNRHFVAEWASPFFYRGVVFVTHDDSFGPSSKYIILRPLTKATWALFSIGILFYIIFLKVFCKLESKLLPTKTTISLRSIVVYIVATFLEQNWGSSPTKQVVSNAIRSLCAFWLLFVLVVSTAYKAKLTDLMSLPAPSFGPLTFDHLANSNLPVGINAIGTGETTYLLFSAAEVKTYRTIFTKSILYPDSTQCILQAVKRNFACVTSEGVAAYTIARNVDAVHGRVPLTISTSRANFVEGGVIFRRQWIFGNPISNSIRYATSMGLVMKWREMHLNTLKAEKHTNRTSLIEATQDNEDGVLKMKEMKSSFLGWITGVLLACLV